MFGHEVLLLVLEIYGENPTYEDGQELALLSRASGDQPNVIDITGIVPNQDFFNGLVNGIRQGVAPNESYANPNVSVTFRNLSPTARGMLQAALVGKGTVTD